MVRVKFSVVWHHSIKLNDANGWEGEECGSRCSFRERRSVIHEILTGTVAINRSTAP